VIKRSSAQALPELTAHHPSAITLRHAHLEVVQGDVLEPETIAGKDVVISAIGARDRAPTTVYSQGVANMIQAMQSADVHRLFCISASGLEPGPLWQRLIAKPILHNLDNAESRCAVVELAY
jgi:putative NADH-flavin reductase